jgi:hypothetical protein
MSQRVAQQNCSGRAIKQIIKCIASQPFPRLAVVHRIDQYGSSVSIYKKMFYKLTCGRTLQTFRISVLTQPVPPLKLHRVLYIYEQCYWL